MDYGLLVYTVALAGLGLVLYCVYRSPRLNHYEVVKYPPVVRPGIAAQCQGAFVKASDPGMVSRQWFHRETLILGCDKSNARGSAEALFLFDLPSDLDAGSPDTHAELSIEAQRTHGGLHSHLGPREKRAIISVNGTVIDEIWLIQKMPNGEDYGHRHVGPIAVDRSLLNQNQLRVTFHIEDQVAWDIDRVLLLVTTGKRRLSVQGAMIAGAVLSVMIGLLPLIVEKLVRGH